MCIWHTGVITFDETILAELTEDQSHRLLRKKHGIPEDSETTTYAVNIEIEAQGVLSSLDPTDWQCRVDQDLLPDWFKGKYAEKLKQEAILQHIEMTRGFDWVFPGDLGLHGCKNLKSLGKLKSVGGNLGLHGCENLKSPKNIAEIVKGNIYGLREAR